jgi:uncharacterized membrane protein YidH (DUF202 family)
MACVLCLLPSLLCCAVQRRKSKSEVQQSVMSRYFYYQFANIWITVSSTLSLCVYTVCIVLSTILSPVTPCCPLLMAVLHAKVHA